MRPAGNDRLDHPLTVAGISLGFWALLLVASRILLVRFGFDPWSFTFIQLIVSGGVLIVLSRGGNVDWRSLRRWSTWVYGALRVTTAATFTAALVHVPVVGAGLLGVMNVPMAALAVWLAFGRRARSSELPGHLCVLAGIVLVTMRLDGGFGSPAFLWVLLSQISVIGGALIAERHPDNNAAEPRARLRFTGVVLLLTALLFLIGRLLFGAGAAALADLVPALLDPALWLSGLAIGLLLRGPSMHLSLKTIRLLGAENYTVVLVALPFLGWLLEAIAAGLNLTPPPAFGMVDLPGAGMIVAGVVLVARARRRLML